MAEEKKNSLAVWSLVCGILGICLCGIFAAIPAIVLGIKGKKKAEEMGGEGKGMAQAGLVLGIVGCALFVVMMVFYSAAIIAAVTGHMPAPTQP